MVIEFFRRGSEGLEQVESDIGRMLADARHSFDLAANAVLAGTKPAAIGDDVHGTDKRINATEREIRRELVVHASVHRGGVDIPLVLAYMAVAKDIERIGDYAKNMFDLADQGIDLSSAPDVDQLAALRDRISLLITQTAQVFRDRATEEARKLISEADVLTDDFDDRIDAMVRSDEPSSFGVPRALLFRYMKRIAAHLMNVLTALVMPVDMLAYYDEAKDDREPSAE